MAVVMCVFGVRQLTKNGSTSPKQAGRPYSVAIGEDSADASAPRRNVAATGGLVSAPAHLQSLRHVFRYAVENFGEREFLGTRAVKEVHREVKVLELGGKTVEKKWFFYELEPYRFITYSQMSDRVNNYGSGLVGLGLKEGDRVAIYDDTCLEWTLCEHACFSQKLVLVTVYSNLGEEGVLHALNEGNITVVQTNADNLSTLLDASDRLTHLKYAIYHGKAQPAVLAELQKIGVTPLQLADVEQSGAEKPVPENLPCGDDLAVIMYTSGSTGLPKGVMISHSNMTACLCAVGSQVKLLQSDVYLSYLPLAHVLALVVEGACVLHGIKIGYGSARTLTDGAVRNCKGDLRELAPTIFAAVPTVYDKVRSAVLAKIAKSSKLLRWLFTTAYRNKLTKIRAGHTTPLLDMLLFNKFKSQLGGRVRFMVSGGAPISPKCHEFLRVCFSVPVLQGYGLTETCGGGALMEMNDVSTGRCGPPVTCTEIKLVDVPDMKYLHTNDPPRGEIWIRGPNLTQGYFNNPEKTEEAFVDGWFRTGDIGEWTPDGSLKVIDRIKNLVKPPHGEYIAIEKLEAAYKACRYVLNICIYVDSEHNDVVALVNVNPTSILNYARRNDLPDSNNLELLCKHHDVIAEVLDSLQRTGRDAKLKSIETVRHCTLYDEEWTPDNGFLTAAMKLNRNAILEACRDDIDHMYGSK
eukprot:CAMPEP_0174242634 /NCGR_PEP_ID=MMETSP0417-20130205/28580_1 /TAXON_ID=242541 /ORGANISM="Mayorella sp, Strain BSH-02190019" /LENGTH=691 /DNA_ID=CAMNT_0015322053 /DNA_START=204 /DNA_END=2279 /DNA_ORIENTATION=-